VLVLAELKARGPLVLCKVAQVSFCALVLCGRVGGFLCLLGFFGCSSFFSFSFSFFVSFLCTPVCLEASLRLFNAISFITYQKIKNCDGKLRMHYFINFIIIKCRNWLN